MTKKRKILIFTDWYVPGFKAGGPIKSIKNLVSSLEEVFDIYVFTSDRDLGDDKSYPELESNKWIQLEKHHVFYCSLTFHSKKVILTEHSDISPDVVYINGVFSNKFSISPLLALKKNANKIIISPRGMFNSGALGLKSKKKKLFITLAKTLKWYKNVHWHVTSQSEKNELKKVIGKGVAVSLIKNIVSEQSLSFVDKQFNENFLKLVFVGRISEVKNINFLIDVLNKVDAKKKIILDIIGSIEDVKYWNLCKSKIDKSKNYKVNLLGELATEKIFKELGEYDFFISPTLNENFGHAIVEAMQSGLPLIISDQTPWRRLKNFEAGFDLSLNLRLWIETLEEVSQFSVENYAKYRAGVKSYYSAVFNIDATHNAYLELFS